MPKFTAPRRVALLILAGAALAPAVATANTGDVVEYDSGFGGAGIVTGPDGNLWFAEPFDDSIGRITPGGTVTQFSAGITAGGGPRSIVAGPDGNLWFTEADGDRIGRITPTGTVTEFSAGITAGSRPNGIAAGPDGNLWFTESDGDRVAKITTAGVVTEYSAGITGSPVAITPNPDGNLWFTESQDRVGKITTAGVVTEFSAGITAASSPQEIVTGADNNLWFTQIATNQIARVTTAGVVTEFTNPIPGSDAPLGITAGRDGNVWFSTFGLEGRIGRITPSGSVTSFPKPPSGNNAFRMTTGPDNEIWFTENAAKIGRMIGGFPGAPIVGQGTASNVSTGGATLNATLNTRGAGTYRFEYGTTTAYGSSTPQQNSAGDSVERGVSAALAGLTPGTTYHFRLVSTNKDGTTGGADATFTTSSDAATTPPPAGTTTPPPTNTGLPPVITKLAISHRCVSAAKLTSPRASRSGLAFSFTVSQNATMTYELVRAVKSPRWTRCPKRAGKSPGKFAKVGDLTQTLGPGGHQTSLAKTAAYRPRGQTVPITGKRLTPGTYLLRVTATNQFGRSKTAHVKFWVVGARKKKR